MSTTIRRKLPMMILITLLMGLGLSAFAQEGAEFVQPAFPPVDGVYRLDFGPPESGVGEGFYQVLPTTAYSAEQGFGYAEGRASIEAFDQNRRVIRDVLQLDDVTRDGIHGGTAFRVDLPDGNYTAVLLTGQQSRPGANRPYSHYQDGTITVGDVTIYQQVNDPAVFFDPAGRYFHNYYHDWHPDVNLYEAMIQPWVPYFEGQVQVAGGSLEVSASRYAPINALWIFTTGNAQGPAMLEQFKAAQQDFFNRQYTWLPDEPEWEMPDLPAEVKAGGAALYVTDAPEELRTSVRPVPRDLGRPLRMLAAVGEREAGAVAVSPLRDASGEITLTVSDLAGANGGALPASAFDIRYIRYGEYPVTGGYEVRPHFLVPWMPDRFEEGLTRGFWVELVTPADAQPGFYSGTLTLAGAGLNASLPIEVRVLPLELPMSRCYQGVYAGDLTSTTFRHYRMSDAKLIPWELCEQVERTRMEFYAQCGFTGLFDSLPWYPLEYNDGNVTPTENWEWYLTVFRIAKSIPNFSERIFCYYLGGPQLFPKCPHYLGLAAADKLPLDQIVFPDEAAGEMTAMTRYLYGELRAQGLPELTFYVFDELGNHGAKGARWGREMLKTLNQCRDATPGGFRTCASTLRSSIAREYLDYADIVMPNRAYPVDAETIAELRDHGCTLGLYNIGATRFSYGFYPWRVDAYNRAQWSFSYDGDTRDPYASLPSGARVSCDCAYTPDWQVLPSIGMLVQREGVDDYRYMQLLEDMIEDAHDTPASRQASGVLDELRQAVAVDYMDPANNWDKSTMDYWRWRVAEAAMKLRETI